MSKFRVIIGLLAMFLSISCSSQSNKEFLLFKNKFTDCKFPIKGVQLSRGNEITQKEFNLFVKKSEFWKYGGDYYYSTSVKFSLDNGIYALIYLKEFYPDNITEECRVCELVTYNSSGEIIDSIEMHGIYGDNCDFSGIIDKDFNIRITSRKYISNSKVKKTVIEYQIIKSTGKIKIMNNK